jgi:hypothetical protein
MSVAGGDIITAATINRALRGGPERPLCILRNSAVQSVANNSVTTPLSWDTEVEDTHGWHSTSSNTSRITPNVAGWVEVTSVIHFAGNSTGRRAGVVKLNGGTPNYGEIKAAGSASGVSAFVVREIEVNGTTDYIEVFPFQDSGGALNTADVTNTFVSVKWLRES